MQQPALHKPIAVQEVPESCPEFSLVLGGPLYQLYRRTKLAQPLLELLRRRIIAVCLICWFPPLLFSIFSGTALGGVKVSFLSDIGANVRFLIALPLLIGAEVMVQRRIPSTVRQFLDRGIIIGDERVRFKELISSTMRVRNSILIEVLVLLLAFSGFWAWREYSTLGGSTWYAVNTDGNMHFTMAGYWYVLVSLPILRFLILRWYFRLALWYWFLWRVCHFRLHLNFLHPDLAGGLGFLSGSALAFSPILMAQTTLVSGIIADEIRYAGATLPNFKMEIVAVVGFLLLLVFAPLSFFVLQLNQAGRTAKREYGILASQYVDNFWDKWIGARDASGSKPLLGTADIQSLADLANGYSVVNKMRLVPIGKQTVIRVAVVACFPLLPLALTMIPLEQIVDRVLKLVL